MEGRWKVEAGGGHAGFDPGKERVVLPGGDPGRPRSAHPRAQGLVRHARGKATRGCRCALPALLPSPAGLARLAPLPAWGWVAVSQGRPRWLGSLWLRLRLAPGRGGGGEQRVGRRPALPSGPGEGAAGTRHSLPGDSGTGGEERRGEPSRAEQLPWLGGALCCPQGRASQSGHPTPFCSAPGPHDSAARSRAEGDREGACPPAFRAGPGPGLVRGPAGYHLASWLSPTQTPSSPLLDAPLFA